MAWFRNSPGECTSGHALLRFGVRMTVMLAVSAFGRIEFDRSLAALMWIAMVFCAMVALVRGERAFGGSLNHWDEAVAYAAVLALVNVFA